MDIASLGEKHAGDVCEECKEKIQKHMERYGKLIMLRPLHHAKKVQSLVCKNCKVKVIKNMR